MTSPHDLAEKIWKGLPCANAAEGIQFLESLLTVALDEAKYEGQKTQLMNTPLWILNTEARLKIRSEAYDECAEIVETFALQNYPQDWTDYKMNLLVATIREHFKERPM